MRNEKMNDFTKDELINIFESLMDTELPVYEDLPSKVSHMIDYYESQLIQVWHCEKCGHVQ